MFLKGEIQSMVILTVPVIITTNWISPLKNMYVFIADANNKLLLNTTQLQAYHNGDVML